MFARLITAGVDTVNSDEFSVVVKISNDERFGRFSIKIPCSDDSFVAFFLLFSSVAVRTASTRNNKQNKKILILKYYLLGSVDCFDSSVVGTIGSSLSSSQLSARLGVEKSSNDIVGSDCV